MGPGLRTILTLLATLLAFLGIHELGHVLAAWLTGGQVGEIVLFSLTPHVQILGSATHTEEAIRAVGGSAASLLACFAVLLARPRWRILADSACAFGCVELAGWSLSALAYAHSPSPDDAERFLAVSGFSAATVVGVCVSVALIGLVVFHLTEQRRNVSTPSRAKAAAA